MEDELEESEWAIVRYEQLNMINEKRLTAIYHGQFYQNRITRAYNKKVLPKELIPEDLILRKKLAI